MGEASPYDIFPVLRATAPDPLFGTELEEALGGGAKFFIRSVFHLKLIGKPPAHWERLFAELTHVRRVVADFNPQYSLAPRALKTRPPPPPPTLEGVDRTLELVVRLQVHAQGLESILADFGWRWNWDRMTAIEIGKGRSARMLERHVLELLTEHAADFELTSGRCREQTAPVMASMFGSEWRDTSSSGCLAQKLKDIHRARTRS